MPIPRQDRPDDRPWTEAEWERFMFEADVRAARYCDLLETLHEHPDCDQIIEHEMGWDRDQLESEDGELSPEQFALHEAAEEVEARREAQDGGADPSEELADEVDTIEAYARAFEWALHMIDSLRAYLQQHEDADADHPLFAAYSNCTIVAAKIAGGHGMNDDGEDETLCANIVCCRKALEAAILSLEALGQAREQKLAPAPVLEPLIAEGTEVRRLVEERIADLRSRVWWE